ncbi:hypothetical protein BCR34DRAFT_208667 [Clohesyomyces aquaticus]|uniref:Uncharacterized protein n=1 Tax=Clohesyomyces aquaticus TaxID=1231657 RepID=A0A1Y2A9U0_9PLEO|nr:hypothetical protein BCR34DRAFT_208667 [Clohesyomyces aquaticus]
MGGQAFATSGPNGTPLNVPRMPPHVYKDVSARMQTLLKPIFQRTIVPRDAPEKLDHGDVDILVGGALQKWTPTTIGEAIGAQYHISNGGSHNFAIPHPEVPDAFVQVDIEISPGDGTPNAAELFEWTNFMKSDADLMQIIGVSHRALGLTSNDRGLHVRVEEIEPQNKKKSQIFLTRKPDEAMAFLGLDMQKYWKGFETEEEIFKWVSNGRFFARSTFDERTEKVNDRQRLRKRGMYRRFMDEWMPWNPEAGERDGTWTRQEVLEEALETFDKRGEYRVLMDEHNTHERNEALWKRIREVLPLEGPSLGMALKGLKRWVSFENGQPYVSDVRLTDDPPSWITIIGDAGEEPILAWVTENWTQVKSLEKSYASSARKGHKGNTQAH